VGRHCRDHCPDHRSRWLCRMVRQLQGGLIAHIGTYGRADRGVQPPIMPVVRSRWPPIVSAASDDGT
jgi:hypothetical protein